MITPTALIDSAIAAYVYGVDHPLKQSCVDVITAARNGHFLAQASVEMPQELLFHRLRMTDRSIAVDQTRDMANTCLLHPFDESVMQRMFDLVASHPRISGRDAVHAATALHHGIGAIISPDTAFDDIPGLRRVDPRDLAGFLRETG